MAFAEINGQRIFFEDPGGDGPPVLFSHGFLMDHEMFAPQVAALTPEFRCITWDERGFGRTESSGDFSYWDSAADALGLLDHLGIESAVLAGMSQGGFLSLRAALTAPERVRALVLMDTQAGGEDPGVLEAYQGMLDTWTGSEEHNPELMDAIVNLIVADEAENPRWIAKWRTQPTARLAEPGRCLMTRDDITDRLGEIRCPALVIHGTADTAIPMEKAEALCAGLVDCRGLVEVEGAAHAANLTHPDQVNPPLLEFLRSL